MTMASPSQMAEGSSRVEVRFGTTRPQRRWTVLIRFILVIPQYVVLFFVGIGAAVVVFLGWFAALFMGRLPTPFARFVLGYVRWTTRVSAYTYLLTDVYPPFALDPDPNYPVDVAVTTGRLNRFAVFFRIILVIPAYIVSTVFRYGMVLFGIVTWIATLILGRMPDVFFGASAAAIRWETRTIAYLWMLTSWYPSDILGDKDTLGRRIQATTSGTLELSTPPPGGGWVPRPTTATYDWGSAEPSTYAPVPPPPPFRPPGAPTVPPPLAPPPMGAMPPPPAGAVPPAPPDVAPTPAAPTGVPGVPVQADEGTAPASPEGTDGPVADADTSVPETAPPPPPPGAVPTAYPAGPPPPSPGAVPMPGSPGAPQYPTSGGYPPGTPMYPVGTPPPPPGSLPPPPPTGPMPPVPGAYGTPIAGLWPLALTKGARVLAVFFIVGGALTYVVLPVLNVGQPFQKVVARVEVQAAYTQVSSDTATFRTAAQACQSQGAGDDLQCLDSAASTWSSGLQAYASALSDVNYPSSVQVQASAAEDAASTAANAVDSLASSTSVQAFVATDNSPQFRAVLDAADSTFQTLDTALGG